MKFSLRCLVTIVMTWFTVFWGTTATELSSHKFLEEWELLEETIPLVQNNQNACATIVVYKNELCQGEPLERIIVPTTTIPNYDCYPSSPFTSTTYYCDKHSKGFHQDVFVGSNDCGMTKPWWYILKIKRYNTTFIPGICTKGVQLESCRLRSCRSEEGWNDPTNVIEKKREK